MKKIYFAALVIMTGFATSAVAQQSDDAFITPKAIVTAQVAVTAGTSLEFKNVTPGVDKTINFAGNVTAGTATGSETAGHFTITKGANTQVTLGLSDLTVDLAGKAGDPNASSTLPITYTHRLTGLASDYTITTPASFVLSQALAPDYYAASTFTLDLGGTVSPINAQAAGEYSTTITLTATYN